MSTGITPAYLMPAMDTSTEQPSSMVHVRASTMYPPPVPVPSESDNSTILLNGNGICTTLSTVEGNESDQVPFPLLCGEGKLYSTRCVDGALVITNYRLYMENGSRVVHVPLGLIELVEVRDLFYLHVWCKDARSFRCTFETNEQCAEMFRNLSQVSAPPRQLLDLFAFRFYAYASEREHENIMYRLGDPINNALEDHSAITDAIDGGFRYEVERLGFDLHGAWKISQANVNYRLCSSYPPQLLVPACITDDTLETVARFRSSRRVPAVVWRHSGNGAVIARCSQPEVGWLGWRSSEDEDLLKAIADACAFDKGPRSIVDMGGGASAPHTPTDQTSIIDGDLSSLSQERPIDAANLKPGKKVLIMDARSYTTAVANRARGGGCECPEYYPSCDIQFMNLANIHSIRKSFHALRQLCSSAADQLNWWSMLEGTRWLQHMSGLMRAATTLAAAVERDARPALVHCSDGWDRTPQIVALAELLLDPYYRTIEGFRVLVEREWLAFGHKFADRCGHSGSDDPNERCPVFLQWLDCIHQLLLQFPCSFQFASTYLVKLAQHTYSNLFGTFLCNTKQERVEHTYDKTFSVWRYLNTPGFKNHLYAPPTNHSGQVLWPACNVRDLKLWSDVYLGMSFTSNSIDFPLQSPTNGHIPPSLPANNIPSHVSLNHHHHNSNSHSHAGGSCARNSTVVTNGKSGATCMNGQAGIASTVAAMTKTRSYGDLIGAAEFCPVVRRCSDPSIAVDSIKMSDLAISSIESDQSENSSESDLITNHNGLIVNTEEDQIVNGTTETFINREIKENNIDIPTTTTTLNNHHVNNLATTNGYTQNKNDLDLDRKLTAEQLYEKFPRNLEFENNWMKTEFTSELLLNLDLKIAKDFSKSDINHNGELNCGGKCDDDSDNENDRSESKSEVTVCNSPNVAATILCNKSATSNETSTDTLVAENGIITSDVPPEMPEGMTEPIPIPMQNGASDGCEVCAQNRKLIEDKQFQHSRSTSGKNSRYSTPPPYTRTPSRCGGGGGGGGGGSIPGSGGNAYYIPTTALYGLDVDGLVTIQSEVQHRLWQLQEEHRMREEALQHDLHKTRMALIKQVCHNCNHNDADKPEDTFEIGVGDGAYYYSSSDSSGVQSPKLFREKLQLCEMNSLVGSVCSTNDGQISGGDSLPSDLSWEALDEGPSLISGSIDGLMLLPNGTSCVAGGSYGASRTLWVPDHAVSRCTGCQTEFWLGRRKHHCRNCGRIFCADCSENSTPLPNEHLYNPVRVCTSCYTTLRRNCPAAAPELTDKCKHSSGAHAAPPAANAQLTASSN